MYTELTVVCQSAVSMNPQQFRALHFFHHHRWLYAALMGLGSAAGLVLLLQVASTAHVLSFLGTFGASSVLLFVAPQAEFSQPKRVIVAYLTITLLGLLIHHLFPMFWVAALVVGASISLMMLCNIVHPPAGSIPLVIYATAPDAGIFLATVSAAVLVLVGFSVVYHRMIKRYWQVASQPSTD
jgi:CBS-domain-containing membrane protein